MLLSLTSSRIVEVSCVPAPGAESGLLPKSCPDLPNKLQGGRTAWSSTVTVQGRNIAARYWYDGQFINNAKEDAAEVALMQFAQQTTSTVSQQAFQGQAGYARGWPR